MNRTVEKAKSIIILLFVVSLLFTSFGNCSSNHQMMDCSGSGKNAVINTDGITSPFLPAGETEIEKLASLLRQQVLPAKNPFGFSTTCFPQQGQIPIFSDAGCINTSASSMTLYFFTSSETISSMPSIKESAS